MKRDISRRAVLAGLGAAITGPAFASAPLESLRPRLKGEGRAPVSVATPESIVSRARLNGEVSFAVAELGSGTPLEGRNAAKGTPPASVTKALTALYALDTLGPSHRFTTQIVATGGIVGGIVQGDLVLMGGGDPTLDTAHLGALAKGLRAAGVGAVRGRFLVWDGAFPRVDRIDDAQPDHVGYNPAVSGIALNFNRVHFEWRRGAKDYSVTMQARATGYKPDVDVARIRLEDRRLPVYTYRATPSFDDWTVARNALGRGGARWLPVRLPGLYAGDVFRTLAALEGMSLPKPVVIKDRPDGEVIAEHHSGDLRTILLGMLKYSNNLTAEMVGLASTVQRRGRVPASLAASAREMNRWAAQELGMTQAGLVDHSGLGDASRMTAQDMCAALVRARDAGLRDLLKPFTLRDSQGRPVKSHPIQVDAKTGTLNFVSSLAGYMTAPSGTEFAFAIFAIDADTRSRISKANREAPQGARSWNRRAKTMQQALIERWATVYGG